MKLVDTVTEKDHVFDCQITDRRFRRKKSERVEAFKERIKAAQDLKLKRKAKSTGRKSKYNAKGQHLDGYWFASQAEADRYLQLKQLEEAGHIDRLELQPKFKVVINNIQICAYLADFQYVIIDEYGSAVRSVIEDVKGMLTSMYRLKKKMVEASYRIEIAEIPSKEVAKNWAGCVPDKRPHEKTFQPRSII